MPPFPGYLYIAIKNKDPLVVKDAKKQPLDPKTILPGMLVRAVVLPMFFDGMGSGISWQGHAVQLIKDDGVRLYGGPRGEDLLTAVENEEAEAHPDGNDFEEAEEKVTKQQGKKSALDLL